MSYTALYRKWRPVSFGDVKGQDPIVKTLKNQITSGRIGHAYLFCGTRGTGKTSIAKIFARAVNCEHPVDGSPCNECETCRHIMEGSSLNVVEIDAASNNGVENIREIREQVQYPPTEGTYRVYIIDEVHMLSIGAFNALLKTLEEPPSYVIFILATTEVHKIPITILSRCQRYDFKRISLDTIADRLRELTEAEHIGVEERALRYVAKAADGSMRDALSLLDQCAAFHFGETLTYDNVLEVLGAVDNSVFSELFRAAVEGRTRDCICRIEEIIIQGRELSQFVNDFVWYLRNLLIVQSADDAENMLDMSAENIRLLKEEAALADADTQMRYIRIFSELSGQMRYASQKRVLLEIAFIKLTRPSMEQNFDSLLQRIAELENRIKEIPSPQELAALAAAGQAGAADRMNGAMGAGFGGAPGTDRDGAGTGSGKAGADSPPAETVILPKAQYEDLMMIKKELGKIARQMGGSVRLALQEAVPRPSGEGCLSLEFTDVNYYTIVNRENVLAELRTLVEQNYQKSIEFKAHLRETSVPVNTAYVSEEDLAVIHCEVEVEP